MLDGSSFANRFASQRAAERMARIQAEAGDDGEPRRA
jgi:hypothetical protein